MRVTSEIFVSALRRRAESAGAFVVLLERGAQSAGAIYVVVTRDNQTSQLYGPAPQSHFDDVAMDRQFELLLRDASDLEIRERLQREKRFDPDIWVVEIEDREGRAFIDVIEPD